MNQVEYTIPAEHAELHKRYLARVASLVKVDTIMWVLLTYGHETDMIDKEMHMSRVRKFLCSGDDTKVKMAVEAMSRTLGEWRSR